MEELAEEVINSFNSLISRLPEAATISLYGFGDYNGLEVIIDNEPISSVEPLNRETYIPDGSTPLYDSISFALTRRDLTSPKNKAEQDFFFIISDGVENDSINYDLNQTRRNIRSARSNGTKIHFIALGEDAYAEAVNLGIETDQTESFAPNKDGVNDAFNNIGDSFGQQSSRTQCDRLIP